MMFFPGYSVVKWRREKKSRLHTGGNENRLSLRDMLCGAVLRGVRASLPG